MTLNPYVKARFNTSQLVMLDVIIALLPLVFTSWLAYGSVALQHIGIAICTALLTEFLFSALLLKKHTTYFDGSAVITALLLVFTLPPATPLYITAFGAFCAILFGKIVWGGLGKNQFNPALIGREFISVFFVTTMTSSSIWKTNDLIKTEAVNLFPGLNNPFLSDYLSSIVFKTNGALGEYSILAIALGGFYLLIKKRISWHIPVMVIFAFTSLCWLIGSADLKFSLAGILFGTLFMATDMPTSPTHSFAKIYYGLLVGITTFLFIKGDVRYEYMSYSILLLNVYSYRISLVFKPTVWGEKRNLKKTIEEAFLLSIIILGSAFAILSLYYFNLISYLIYLYIAYIILKFNNSFSKNTSNII